MQRRDQVVLTIFLCLTVLGIATASLLLVSSQTTAFQAMGRFDVWAPTVPGKTVTPSKSERFIRRSSSGSSWPESTKISVGVASSLDMPIATGALRERARAEA